MFAQSVLYGSILLTLISPLVAAAVLGVTFFFKGTPERFEKKTFRCVRYFYLLSLSCSVIALATWLILKTSHGSFEVGKFNITPDFAVDLWLIFDSYSLIFLLTSAFITSIITFFSHRYLHRDPGYRRFFIIISLFSFGMNLIVLAGTFDLLFAGWEIVGLSSFLLIGYFWHRPKAIAAACRTYYIYRVCDLGLLTSILIAHFFWHDISVFADFSGNFDHSVLAHVSNSWRWLLSLCILMPVLAKSAQFPFSFWLPKAMEGPTHSSAIFYGSLSIHVGIFLLIRTFPIWYHTPGFPYLLAGIGIITGATATLFAFVQSNIKGQIGYASVAQVGLMLIELSLGLTTIAFIHMIGNAFLRCFQLLVSPSILTTHLHMQNVVRTFGAMGRFSVPNLIPERFRPTLYVFAINDGYVESTLKKLFVAPTMHLAKRCNALFSITLPRLTNRLLLASDTKDAPTLRSSFYPLLIVLFAVVIFDLLFRSYETVRLLSLLGALILALGALGESEKPARSLMLAIFGNLFAFLSITSSKPGLLYLVGLITSAVISMEAMRYINTRRTITDLRKYHGLYQQFPLAGTMLLIGILGVVSFPFSSTFYGEDVMLNLSVNLGLHYLLVFQIIFIITGIALIRVYTLVMFGRRGNFMTEVELDFSVWQAMARLALFIIGNGAAFALALS